MGADGKRPAWLRIELLILPILLLYPLFPFLDHLVHTLFGASLRLDRQLVNIFIFAILALALNLQVGYAGLLQLGIAAFFAIGAFSTGVLTVEKYPFQMGFWGALAVAPVAAGMAGLALGAPTIRLKGDYLAIVTLGFGEVTRVVILNLENITDGPRGLNPIPTPWLPGWLHDFMGAADTTGRVHFLTMYYVALLLLAIIVVVFRNLERARAGRELIALREDELATSCMGINPARTKLVAFAVGAGIAGLAGALYATNLTTTAEPNTYDFNYSIMVLCCLIIGGLGSLRGVLLGAAVLLTFDNVISPLLTQLIQRQVGSASTNVLASFSNWRWIVFGTALVLMMRYRPEGLWPSKRVKEELHHE
jgi:branched-chain amino acid transport system permease protein